MENGSGEKGRETDPASPLQRPKKTIRFEEMNGEEPTRARLSSDQYRKPLSTMFQSIDEDYCQKLPRKGRKKRPICLGFSCYSWLFLLLAFLQAAIILGIQVAIAVLGNFRNGRLENYVPCFEESIGYGNGSELPANITFPTFGRDKEVYVYFFISLMLYNFALVIYALKVHNIVEVYMFLIINVLAIGYAGVQVFQFRGFGQECDIITTVGFLALGNGCVLIVLTVVFLVMTRSIYVEFGWKIYTRVGCNSELRWYYRVYEVFMSGVKLLILFMLIFLISQCILLLYVDENNIDYEFWVVIFAFAPACIAAFPIIRWIVRREHIIGSIALIVTDVALIAYNSYKVYRYTTRSCPLCREQVDELQRDIELIEEQLNTTGSTSVREIIDRIEQFEHLVLLGVINLVIAILVLLVFLYLLKQYGKGLKQYFSSQRTSKRRWFHCCCCTTSSDKYEFTDSGSEGGKRSVFLDLRRAAHRFRSDKSTTTGSLRSGGPGSSSATDDLHFFTPSTRDGGGGGGGGGIRGGGGGLLEYDLRGQNVNIQ